MTFKIGDEIRIRYMDGEPSYTDRTGVIEHIDSIGQLHGTWGGLAVVPEVDKFDVIDTKFSVELVEYPNDDEWIKVKERALVTIGKKAKTKPDENWKIRMLCARHSPIRRLFFSFYIECPYWVSVHLVRHIHAQPYVKSQRNDRQNNYDRTKAPQDETVSMIWDMNAEELMNIANKRLCNQASKETRDVVREMCRQVIAKCPEFKDVLVPRCEWENGCKEMFPCGKRG